MYETTRETLVKCPLFFEKLIEKKDTSEMNVFLLIETGIISILY